MCTIFVFTTLYWIYEHESRNLWKDNALLANHFSCLALVVLMVCTELPNVHGKGYAVYSPISKYRTLLFLCAFRQRIIQLNTNECHIGRYVIHFMAPPVLHVLIINGMRVDRLIKAHYLCLIGSFFAPELLQYVLVHLECGTCNAVSLRFVIFV